MVPPDLLLICSPGGTCGPAGLSTVWQTGHGRSRTEGRADGPLQPLDTQVSSPGAALGPGTPAHGSRGTSEIESCRRRPTSDGVPTCVCVCVNPGASHTHTHTLRLTSAASVTLNLEQKHLWNWNQCCFRTGFIHQAGLVLSSPLKTQLTDQINVKPRPRDRMHLLQTDPWSSSLDVGPFPWQPPASGS